MNTRVVAHPRRGWNDFEACLRRHAVPVVQSLRGPATIERIEEVEAFIGVRMPDDVRAAYLAHDGCSPEFQTPGLLPIAARWCSLDDVCERWRFKTDGIDVVYGDWHDRPRPEASDNWSEETVRNEYWHPRWIPVGVSNHPGTLAVDMIAAPRGHIGQIIYCDGEPRVIAPSFSDWMQTVIKCADKGLIRFDRSWVTTELGAPASAKVGYPVFNWQWLREQRDL